MATYGFDEAKNRVEIFPVGAIYLSVVNTNPGQLFGGTWEQIKDRFLLSAGNTYQAGATGGEASHTLTVSEIPSHTHTVNGSASAGSNDILINGEFQSYASGDQDGFIAGATEGELNVSGTATGTGGGQAHNNMPPYLTVYMWKRVS